MRQRGGGKRLFSSRCLPSSLMSCLESNERKSRQHAASLISASELHRPGSNPVKPASTRPEPSTAPFRAPAQNAHPSGCSRLQTANDFSRSEKQSPLFCSARPFLPMCRARFVRWNHGCMLEVLILGSTYCVFSRKLGTAAMATLIKTAQTNSPEQEG